MSVSARFYVSEITKRPTPATVVVLQPVLRATEDNVSWSKFTPSGRIELSVSDPQAAAWFEGLLGSDVAISFSEVVAPE
jgi:hypothetical protein